ADGTFAGTINGAAINGGTITGATINGGTINTTNDITVGRNINMGMEAGNLARAINFGDLARLLYSYSNSMSSLSMRVTRGSRYVQTLCQAADSNASTYFDI